MLRDQVKSLLPFLGALDFETSRSFYRDLGFEEDVLDDKLSAFKLGPISFYLQNAYVKDWIENTMVFVEVEDVNEFWVQLSATNITQKYKKSRLTPIKKLDWGSECFMHDPSGILWHFGEFNK